MPKKISPQKKLSLLRDEGGYANPAWKRLLFCLLSNIPEATLTTQNKMLRMRAKKAYSVYSVEDLKKFVFNMSSEDNASVYLSRSLATLEKLGQEGGSNFIESKERNCDRRKRDVCVNTAKLEIWIDNLLNHYIQTKLPTLHALEFGKAVSTRKLIAVHPRLVVMSVLHRWNKPHAPKKEYLAEMVYRCVTAEVLRNYAK